jgi:hypothetical protein
MKVPVVNKRHDKVHFCLAHTTVAIVEKADDPGASLTPTPSATTSPTREAAVASELESAILLEHTTTTTAADNAASVKDDDEMLTLVRNDATDNLHAPSSPAAANGVAHKPADDGHQPIGNGDVRDVIAVSTNGVAPGMAAAANGSVSPVQVVSAVSGKKMSIAEARAEFFNASRS